MKSFTFLRTAVIPPFHRFITTTFVMAVCLAASGAPVWGEVNEGKRATGGSHMVAAAHPLAARAGMDILERGGNAVDAAVAMTFVLGVVEPMMSGLGGGGGMTIWDNQSKRADYICAYPAAGANPDFSTDTPERRVAIPGTVAGLFEAHRAYGSLPWEELPREAIRLAREGFPVYPLLANDIADTRGRLTHDSEAAAVFYPDGEPLQAGDLLRRPVKAGVLERIALEGRDGFYTGPVARGIVQKLQAGGSTLTVEDFANFEPKWRRPVCGSFGPFTVFSAAPPLSGVEVLQSLALMEAAGILELPPPTGDGRALGILIDALRVARVDRQSILGEPVDGNVPANALTHPGYVEKRMQTMGLSPAPARLRAGDPGEFAGEIRSVCGGQEVFTDGRPAAGALRASPRGDADEDESGETTHLAVVDKEGNAVSLTHTMGLFFGSGAYAGGMFFNTVGGNFSNNPEANRPGAGRTPLSSTAPTLVVEGDQLRLVVGSPGSGRIPPAIASMILYTLGHDMDPGEAIAMPRVYPFINSPEIRVEGGFSGEVLADLRGRGYDLTVHATFDRYFGGVHMIKVGKDGRLTGAADPRRNGVAIGR